MENFITETMKLLAVNFANWMINNECSAPLTTGNVPLWIGNGIDLKTSEELYELFLIDERNRILNKYESINSVCECTDDTDVEIISLEPPISQCTVCGKKA